MKKLLLIAFLVAGSLQMIAQDGIQWMSMNEALEAQKENPKKIFMDAYTDWCGPCKLLDKNTFGNKDVINFVNKNYYPVKFNAEMSEPIDFNGHTFVNPNPGKSRSTHQFAASILEYQLSYPSYVILDENLQRSVIYKGYLQVDDLLGIILFFGKNRNQAYLQQITKQVKQQQAVKK